MGYPPDTCMLQSSLCVFLLSLYIYISLILHSLIVLLHTHINTYSFFHIQSNNPRIEYQPVWSVEEPFRDVAVFGCVTGVASLQPDGRHTCLSRTCPNIQSAVVGLPSEPSSSLSSSGSIIMGESSASFVSGLNGMISKSSGSSMALSSTTSASSSSSSSSNYMNRMKPSTSVTGSAGAGAYASSGGLRGNAYVPTALRRKPYGQRQLLAAAGRGSSSSSNGDDGGGGGYMDEEGMIEESEEEKLAKKECDEARVSAKNKICREGDQTGCILPQLSWKDILSGNQQTLGESGEGVTHGNYKWKNMGATMWKAKQKGKDPKFWKKGSTEEEE
jgi:hypothetical protein